MKTYLLPFLAYLLILPAQAVENWTPLFNGKNLDGLYTFLGSHGKNADPNGIFKVRDGMIHVLATENGYVATEKTYANYHLRFQFKWGASQPGKKRNSGMLYHITGPDKLWPRCVECQGQESDVGDLILIGGNLSVETTVKSLTDARKTFAPGGQPFIVTNHLSRAETADTPDGWNTVEVIARGNSAKHYINGKLVFELKRIFSTDTGAPIDAGRIAFQAEGAEIFFRNIEIAALTVK